MVCAVILASIIGITKFCEKVGEVKQKECLSTCDAVKTALKDIFTCHKTPQGNDKNLKSGQEIPSLLER